jgi:uncharacterized protein GlcG (DUF336 family)
MKTTIEEKSLSYQAALLACEASIKKAEDLGIAINVSVCDAKGLELSFIRMNDAYIHSINIAKDKAFTSASFGFPSGQWTEIFKGVPHLEQGFSNRDRLIPFGGGLPIFENGVKVGAIGVSGGTEEEDIICANSGIENIGLK